MDPGRDCVVFISHAVNEPLIRAFERLVAESPADHDVLFLLNSDAPPSDAERRLGDRLVRITREEILGLGYPEKCRRDGWKVQGNVDLIYLLFRRRRPGHARYWFVEYDVHWEGRWSALFEHFRASAADVLGGIMHPVAETPHKLDVLNTPRVVVPEGFGRTPMDMIKGFVPICRLSGAALEAMDAAYARGLCGHAELCLPTAAAWAGLVLEDFGGRGPYVRPENRDRFYFAREGSYTHSPGTFVFRPAPRVLPRPNTLWHPVKPAGIAPMHPMRVRGNPAKNVLEWLKPLVWRCAIRLWFALRWRPLRTQA